MTDDGMVDVVNWLRWKFAAYRHDDDWMQFPVFTFSLLWNQTIHERPVGSPFMGVRRRFGTSYSGSRQ